MDNVIIEICNINNIKPTEIKRISVGLDNYVFYIKSAAKEYVIRCNIKPYNETIKLTENLYRLGVPVPQTLFSGKYKNLYYMISAYIYGKDLGLVYADLSLDDKRIIAKEVCDIQNKISDIKLTQSFSQADWVKLLLKRAKERIAENNYFDLVKVDIVADLSKKFEEYFCSIKPIAYLDDISTKNLMINNGRVSGIVDTDWLGYGDPLTFVALTNVALLNDGYDTLYVDCLLEEMKISQEQKKAFLFYSLLYCVDFMSERGMNFNGNRVEVSSEIIASLNAIYDRLLADLEIANQLR
ncbi:MAG: phosphotransferase [Clostridia bacterium]|nr:phosphotransferase [Clostridia bacterium]